MTSKFESKVLAIEERQDLQTLTIVQIHGILTAFEMRQGGPSQIKEAEIGRASCRERVSSPV